MLFSALYLISVIFAKNPQRGKFGTLYYAVNQCFLRGKFNYSTVQGGVSLEAFSILDWMF